MAKTKPTAVKAAKAAKAAKTALWKREQGWDKLPAAARAYLRALEELSGCPLAIVSTGPDRDHTMVLQDPFA